MHSFRALVTLIALASLASPLAAVDLAKIDRTISKEPKYKSAPRYFLLAFGPEAKFCVWLVFDGDTLYVDRNGNGDLTEPGERVEPAGDAIENRWNRGTMYNIGPIEDPFTRKKYAEITILRLTRNPLYVPENQEEKEIVASMGKRGTLMRMQIRAGEKIAQSGHTFCAGSAAKARILHFDGPLTFHLVDPVVLKRGGEPVDLRVELGSRGLGTDVYQRMSFEIAPKDVHPLVEMEFPSAKSGGPPIKVRLALKQRC